MPTAGISWGTAAVAVEDDDAIVAVEAGPFVGVLFLKKNNSTIIYKNHQLVRLLTYLFFKLKKKK